MVGLKLWLQEMWLIQSFMLKAEKIIPHNLMVSILITALTIRATCSVGEIVACASGAYTGGASCVCCS